ncbi:MAG: HU family DNA-binding protein [Parvibaculum sp.]
MATKPAAKPAVKKPAVAAKKPAAAKPAAAAAKKAPTQVTIPLSKIIAELAEEHEMSKKAAAAFFDSFVQLTVKNLKKGNKVRITGLGILAVRKRAARMGRNPATGEAIKIKASKKVAFRVAKDLKEAI